MSVSYPADPLKPYADRVDVVPAVESANQEPFIPVYARRGKSARRKGGKIKTWMILTPVGLLVLAGLGVVALRGGEETVTPLSEPAATAPVVSATPLVAPVMSASTPAAIVRANPAPAPVLRRANPVRRAAPIPARPAAATLTPRAAAPAPTPRVATPVPAPTSAPATSQTPMLNMAPMTPAPAATPAPAPVPSPPPPFVIVEPVG